MSSHRFRRLAAIISSTLLGLALIGPSSVAAAQPGWTLDVVTLPSAVSPGSDAGYRLTIRNTGSSNISQLYLTDSVTSAPTYLAGDRTDLCNPTGVLYCSFGALNAGDVIVLTVAHTTPTTGSSFSPTFMLNTTGASFADKGKNSHGDTLLTTVTTSLSGDQNFAGGFVLSSNFEVKNGGVTRTNIQSTSAAASGTNIPVTVQDGSGVPAATCAAVANAFGECSKVDVAESGNVAGGIKIVITVYWKSVPRNLDVNAVVVTHTLADGTTQTINTSCGVDPTSHLDPGCRDAVYDADKNLVITVWTLSNGGFRGGL